VPRFILVVIAAAGAWMTARPAHRESVAERAEPAARPIRLVVAPAAAGEPVLAADPLAAALSAELGRPVAQGGDGGHVDDGADCLTIAYAPARGELTVDFRPGGGAAVVRTVRAQGTPDAVARLAVLLAGNVARDQAGELLGPPAGTARPSRPSPLTAGAVEGGSVPAIRAEAPSLFPDLGLGDVWARLRVRPVVWVAQATLVNVAVSLSDGAGYALVGAAAHVENGRSMAGGGLALGARIPLPVELSLESDLGATFLYNLDRILPGPSEDANDPTTWGYTTTRLVTRVRSALVYSGFAHVSVFLGGALALTTHFYGAVDNDWGPDLFGGVRL
jgi:hypothetical protein